MQQRKYVDNFLLSAWHWDFDGNWWCFLVKGDSGVYFGATELIASTGSIYMLMIMISAPFTFVLTVFIAYKRSYGGTKEALNTSFIAMGIKLVLSWIFVIEKGMGLYVSDCLCLLPMGLSVVIYFMIFISRMDGAAIVGFNLYRQKN